MTFNCEEIKKLANPYKDLGSSDALAEHREELDKLSSEEMITLASKMILDCPGEELDTFGQALNALNKSSEEPGFHAIIYQAYEVKKRVTTLLNPKYTHPHTLLSDDELNEEGFLVFNEVALKTLENNESEIAERLALTTPEKSRSALARNVRNLFPDSEFSSRVAAAFTLRRDIDQLLLSEKPEHFFCSPEFNIDLCLEFAPLLSHLISGKEQAIGEKLARLDSRARHEISFKLEGMTQSAITSQNPFRLIMVVINSSESSDEVSKTASSKEESKNTGASVSSNESLDTSSFNHFFNNLRRSTGASQPESDSESVDDDSCYNSYCGMFDK